MSVALLHAMHIVLAAEDLDKSCHNALSTYTRSTVLLTRSLAHCSWPIQLDKAVLAAYTCSSSPIASTIEVVLII